MRSILVNKSLAGKSFQATTSRRTYPVDAFGCASIFDDNPAKKTKDYSEAVEAGFSKYDPGERVKMVNPKLAAREEPREIAGDVEIVTVPAGDVTCPATGHQYHASDDGEIDAFSIDREELEAAGFVAA